MTTRRYLSTSQETTLASALSSGATTMVVNSASGLLGSITPASGETFTVVIDPDTSLEEIVDVIYPSTPGSTTLTIARNVEAGSAAIAHSAGAKVRHMAIGRDFREANTHIENTTAAHGLTIANVVQTTDTATVANGMIANLAVTTAKLADLNVTTGKIADSAITSAKIADLTIATGDIADSAITSAKIADGTIVNADINAAAAIDKTKISGIAITAADSGTVTSAMIANDTIINADINTAAAIDKTKIAGTAVTQADSGTVTSSMIADGTIVNGDISSTAAIAYSKLNLASSITSSDIADGAIVNADVNTSAQIAYGKLNLSNSIVAADINASAAIPMSKLAVDPTLRSNHTGTQIASTISDFDTQVRTSKVTDLAAPTGSFSMNNQKITSLATPTANTDAATKAYADLMIPLTQKGVANGVAELDSNGLVPTHHLPALAISETFVVASQAAMLALTAQTGDVAVRSDQNKSYILTATPASTLANWQELLTPTDAVLSVDGMTGAVNLSSSYATIAQDAAKLPLAGGTMSGAIAMGTNKITGLGNPTNAQDAVTKYYLDNVVLAPSNLTGPITSVGNITSVASQTGTGSTFVMNTSPTLVTPTLGAATATSINGTTIPTSKTLVATDSTTYVVPSQTGNSGKYLTTDGTISSWGTVSSYSAPTIGSTSIASGATVTTIAGLTLTAPVVNLATNAQASNYTLALSDASDLVEMSGGGTLTVPTNASVAFPIGTQINILQTGASQVTVGGAGVTINATPGLKLRAQWSGATLVKRATDTWVLVGDLSA